VRKGGREARKEGTNERRFRGEEEIGVKVRGDEGDREWG